MKNAHTILSHLSQQPQFRFLKRHECYQKYIRLLGEKYRKAIAFVYVKNETLFVAVTHPGFKMELNYNRDLLKDVLTQFSRFDPGCAMLKAEKVVIFQSKYHQLPAEEVSETVPHYSETAMGVFPIETDDEALQTRFEKIKVQIEKNR